MNFPEIVYDLAVRRAAGPVTEFSELFVASQGKICDRLSGG